MVKLAPVGASPFGHAAADARHASAAATGGPSIRSLGAALRRGLERFDGGYRPRSRAAPPPGAAAIELDNVSVAYGDRLAVSALTGVFPQASLTAVVGPNGAGKSSLLKAMARVLPLRSGAIRYRPAGDLAYLPQRAELDRGFPVRVGELVALGAWRTFGAFRRPPDAVFDRVAEAAASTGIDGWLDRSIEGLSAGELQRALFARLIMQDAAVILLDEPFAGVDEATSEDLLRLVRGWHQTGRTVVAVLHDLDQVRAYFPTTLLLARSCIAWGDTTSVLTQDNLVRARTKLQPPGRGTVPA
jgi:zinc/manganese transport system ATP-binding protein